MKARILFLALLCGSAAMAQVPNPSVIMVTSDPSGACPANLPWRYNYVGLTAWFCGAGSVWTKFGTSSSSGTVTSITATSPLTGGTITASGSIGIQDASGTQLGAVQGDASTVTINGSGVLSCTTATSSQIGCAKFGSGLGITAGNVTANNAQLQTSTGAASTMTAATQYYMANGVAAGMTTGTPGASYGISTAVAGSAQNMYVNASAAVSAGSSVAFSLWKNGVLQALTCTMAAAAFRCNDTTGGHAVTVAAGDVLVIGAVCTGTCGASSVGALQGTIQIQ